MPPWLRPFIFGQDRPLKGFVYVAAAGFESDDDLADRVKRCMDFVATLPASQARYLTMPHAEVSEGFLPQGKQ